MMKLIMQLSLLILAAAAATTIAAAEAQLPQALPNCPTQCGNLKNIPYPFGIGDGCFLPQGNEDFPSFGIVCNDSTDPPKAIWAASVDILVSNISLQDSELQILQYVARDCYDKQGVRTNFTVTSLWTPFIISDTKNKFMAVGCDTDARVVGYRGEERYVTGCITYCESLDSVTDTSCSGVGCCQTSIPSGLHNQTVSLGSFANHTGGIWDFNPCSYAFIAQEGHFKFSTKILKQLESIEKLPILLDWAIGNDSSCDEAKKRKDFICNANSECVDPPNQNGYICRCSPGYHGNPYLPEGCQDINECEKDPCDTGSTCQNKPGSYSCNCDHGYKENKGYTEDGKNGTRCTKDHNNIPLIISLGIIAGLFVLLVGIFWIYCGMKRRKFKKLQDKNFKQNGGLLLKQQLVSYNGSVETAVRIFTEEELKKATNNYHLSGKIGEGGYGTVYKGILSDKKVVAIKKSKINAAPVQSNQFANEVIILSQISHRNVVRLLGCCLETPTPILVYEYITNGTLYDRIQRKGDKAGSPPLSLASRLSIAADTADALSYLHYSTSIQIIHRDVKTTNILLDGSDMAKVSDFGVSRLVPEDKDQVSTLVQGTLGYLDPEYLQSHTLTEKSDVYSFGVVLVELLTGQKVISPQKPEEERNLAKLFVCSVEKGCLDQILDKEIVKEGNFDTVEKVADLAQRCLRLRGDERPSMREVFMELEGYLMRDMAKHAGGGKADFKPSPKDSDHLLGSPPNLNAYFVDVKGEGDDGGSTTIFTSSTTDYDSSMQINSSPNVKTIYDAGR